MRKRYGQGTRNGEADAVSTCSVTEDGGPVEERDGGEGRAKEKFRWMNALTAGAQLTLDIIRVIREATDLYRKLARG